MSASGMKALRELQRNLAGSSDDDSYYHNKKPVERVDGTEEKFRQAVKDFFDNIGNYKEELGPLLTLKVPFV